MVKEIVEKHGTNNQTDAAAPDEAGRHVAPPDGVAPGRTSGGSDTTLRPGSREYRNDRVKRAAAMLDEMRNAT